MNNASNDRLRRHSLRTASALLPLAMIALACVGAPPELTAEELAAQTEFVLTEAPSPEHLLDIGFESRLRLVGYDVSVEEVTPGQPFDVTWYWHVERRLPGEFALFTHIADATDTNRCNADRTNDINGCNTVAPLRERLAPSVWAEGTWVRDPQQVTLPADWHSESLTFYIGVYAPEHGWTREHRLSVTTGPTDGDGRGRALTLPIAGGARTHAALPAPGAHGHRG